MIFAIPWVINYIAQGLHIKDCNDCPYLLTAFVGSQTENNTYNIDSETVLICLLLVSKHRKKFLHVCLINVNAVGFPGMTIYDRVSGERITLVLT